MENENYYSNKIGDSVDPNQKILKDGLIRIVWDNSCLEYFVDPLYDKPLSLDDCVKFTNYKSGVIFITYDEPLKGTIFMYGNYMDNKWYVYGTTMGYC